jgi:hypothetical protein
MYWGERGAFLYRIGSVWFLGQRVSGFAIRIWKVTVAILRAVALRLE